MKKKYLGREAYIKIYVNRYRVRISYNVYIPVILGTTWINLLYYNQDST